MWRAYGILSYNQGNNSNQSFAGRIISRFWRHELAEFEFGNFFLEIDSKMYAYFN